MIVVLAVGLLAMLACLAMQSFAFVHGAHYFTQATRQPPSPRPRLAMFRRLSIIMLVLMASNIVQVALWALLYRVFGPIEDFETALYFSGVTFTTIGYGDVLLTGRIRLLAPLEAATGVMMFGLSTAAFVAAIQHAMAEAGRRRALTES